jgi:HK97 family phage prohead protease
MDQIRKYGYEVKDIDSNQGIVTLYANAFNVLDSDNDLSLEGSFKKTIKDNFSRVKWFLNHDRTQLLGVPLEAREDKFGLLVRGQLNLKKDIAKDILEDYILYNQNGKTLEHSIGVSAVKYEILENDAVPLEYRKRGIKWMRQVSEWKWWEYSTLTSWGANENTPLVSIKDLQNIDSTIDWLEKMLEGNYTDTRIKQIQQLIEGFKSLKNEPSHQEEITHGEPIDINKLLDNYSLFKTN